MTQKSTNGRDQNGRWVKGHCPNPNGRPRKEPPVSGSDMRHFKQTTVKATILGEVVELTRHELLLHKMYENALKGSNLAQRKLFDRFEQSDNTFAEAQVLLRHLAQKLCEQHDETGRMEPKDYEEYDYYYRLVHGRHFHETDKDRPPRSRRRPRVEPDPSSWRTGPKPQAILDLEKEWAEVEAYEEAAHTKPQTPPPDDPKDT